jgi:hypothetical protein
MVSKKIALFLIISLSSVTALLAAYHDNSVTSEGVKMNMLELRPLKPAGILVLALASNIHAQVTVHAE